MIATHEGAVISSTLDNIQTQQYSTLVAQLASKAKGCVRDLDPEVGDSCVRRESISNQETKSHAGRNP